jgi:hypothetical protein
VAIVYPANIDSFSVPTLPESTSLSSSGTSTRNHPQSHQDLGAAVVALETNTSPLAHDHSTTDGGGIWPTGMLLQANTHQSPDTDAAVGSLHHSIGNRPTQAAAGNHAHDYAGPSIFNQPLMICTSTTRPVDPIEGEVIYETDTKCFRSWDDFNPANVINLGIQGTDLFTRVSNTNLDVALWAQTYVTGNGTTNGTMATPVSGAASWIIGTDTTSRCIARRVNSADQHTQTDDQVLDMYFGSQSMDFEAFTTSPTDDGYLRMSDDGQSYVRFQVDSDSVNIYWTTTGPSGEVFLGGTAADTRGTAIHWTFKAIGQTFIIYQGGGQIGAVVDSQNVTALGSANRGWAIGMSAAPSGFGEPAVQLRPASIDEVVIADQPFYTGGLIWQLLPIGATPFIRAEAHFGQIVVVGDAGGVCGFDTVLEDWFFSPFMAVDESQTDITIQESGHYDVHASIAWDPGFFGFDHTMVGITVNGLDIGRKNWEFVRGNGFAPGFSQTNEIFFSYYFVKGDILRVNARHNSPVPAWLWFFDTSPDRQMCWVEVSFRGV